MPMTISRRTFAGTLGLAAGAALLETPLARTAEAAARRPKPAGAILLNSNENPYGLSPRAVEALVAAVPRAPAPLAVIDSDQDDVAGPVEERRRHRHEAVAVDLTESRLRQQALVKPVRDALATRALGPSDDGP